MERKKKDHLLLNAHVPFSGRQLAHNARRELLDAGAGTAQEFINSSKSRVQGKGKTAKYIYLILQTRVTVPVVVSRRICMSFGLL